MTWMLVGLLVTGAVETEREAPRLRGAIGLAGGFGFSPREPALGVGGGITFDVGATFADQHAVVLRGVLTTSIYLQLASAGISYETIIGDQLALSAGIATALIGGGPDTSAALAMTAPVRGTFLFATRSDDQRGRRGLAVFLEVAPGITYYGGSGYGVRPNLAIPPLCFTTALGVSYVWW